MLQILWKEFVLMDQRMQEYLRKVAIQTKIENYKEFNKNKEETILAIQRKFQLLQEEAETIVEEIWEQDILNCGTNTSVSLLERREQLKKEREQNHQYPAPNRYGR